MKRILTVVSLLLITCLALFAMTACGGSEVTIGENGNWFIGEEDTGVKAAGTNATIGENGNWYLDGTDTGKKAVGTDAERVSIGQNGNWFIGATDTGVKAVCGKYVVDVKTSTELDVVSGTPYAVTVITYSDGTTEVQKNAISERVSTISLIDNNNFVAGYAPYLKLHVITVSSDSYEIPVTDDMFIGSKPDFNTPGTYPVTLVYGGQMYQNNVTVIDATGITVTDMHVNDSRVLIGTPAAQISVYVHFNNGSSYSVSLASCTSVGAVDFTTVGHKEFSVTYGGYTASLSCQVYDPSVDNISSVQLPVYTGTIAYNATPADIQTFVNTNLVGQFAQVHLFESMYGRSFFNIPITADMVDVSGVNTAMLGRHVIKVNVNLPGIGSSVENVSISVVADVSGANVVKTYTTTSLAGSMLGSITAYDNGIAVLSGMGGMQATYTVEGNRIVALSSGMTMYFTVDNTNNTYDIYTPAGEQPSATYVSAEEGMKVCVYSDCVTIGMYSAASGSTPEMHAAIYSLPVSSIVNNQINVSGMVITLNSDGTLTMAD